MDKFEKIENLKGLSDDVLIARKLLNLCSKNIPITVETLQLLESIKYRHIKLALDLIDSNEVQDMVLFEYLLDNIKNAPEYIDEEEVYF